MHERIHSALEDMIEYAQEAQAIVHDHGVQDIQDDRVIRLAMERALEIVGEAATRVPDFVRDQVPINWRQVVGLRNVISHRYDQTDIPTMLNIIEDDLGPMQVTILAYLEAQ